MEMLSKKIILKDNEVMKVIAKNNSKSEFIIVAKDNILEISL